MTEHMSAAEYRRLMSQSSNDGAMSDDKFQQALEKSRYHSQYSHPLAKNAKKNQISEVTKKVRNHEEDDVTKQVTEYLEVLKLQGKVVLFSHVPQETFTKSWVTKKKNKEMGVRAGVPDMLIVYPDRVLFLELKRLKGGVLSDAQKAWIEALNAVQIPSMAAGHQYVVAKVACGFDEAKEIIDLQVLD